ncbi:DegV family protein [Chloroflexota bacterium]
MVRVVTESTADIPRDMVARLGIAVVPSYVVFGKESYRDGVELDKGQFYEKLASTRAIPTTAAPPPGVYEKVYRQLAEETDEIISIHLAAGLSALYSSAALAASSVSEAKIVVIDSEQVSMGYGWMAVAAAEAAQQGESLDQIVALVKGMKRRSWILAVLDTLEFVHRGGRVGWVQAMVGTLLQIKPIIQVRMSEVKLLERNRTLKRSLGQLMNLIQAMGPLERAIVLHADAPDLAEQMADLLQTWAPGWERLVGQAGVTVASHAGPGAIGVACVTSN